MQPEGKHQAVESFLTPHSLGKQPVRASATQVRLVRIDRVDEHIESSKHSTYAQHRFESYGGVSFSKRDKVAREMFAQSANSCEVIS